MSRLYGQATQPVLESTLALAATASRSGSAISTGYSNLVGMFYANASAAAGAGSGLHILQSANYGANWDIVSASYPITASAASTFSVAIVGNAVKVHVWNGVTEAASLVRAWFTLRPV
jgi:hypothetical protein